MKTKLTTGLAILLFWALLPGSLIYAQSRHDMAYDTAMVGGLQYRNVGPFRGGRSTAVAGYNDDPFTFLMGTTGGGIWKTTDAGNTWLILAGLLEQLLLLNLIPVLFTWVRGLPVFAVILLPDTACTNPMTAEKLGILSDFLMPGR